MTDRPIVRGRVTLPPPFALASLVPGSGSAGLPAQPVQFGSVGCVLGMACGEHSVDLHRGRAITQRLQNLGAGVLDVAPILRRCDLSRAVRELERFAKQGGRLGRVGSRKSLTALAPGQGVRVVPIGSRFEKDLVVRPRLGPALARLQPELPAAPC